MSKSKNKQKIVPTKLLATCIIFAIVIGAFYSCFSLKFYENRAKIEAIGLAASVASFIDPYQIKTLNADSSDVDSEVYKSIKRGLIEFKALKTGIEYAYLLEMKDEKLFFLVDSEVPESKGYSAPGQEYFEASEQDVLPFSTGKAVLTKPQTDRWGTWISALVPIIEPRTGKVVAIFGIDFPAEYWKSETYRQVLPKVAFVTCMILLLSVLFSAFMGSTKARTLSKKLSESEALFKAIFEQSPVGISLVGTNESQSKINAEFARILGRTKEKVNSVSWREITHPDDLEKDLEQFAEFESQKIPGYSLEKRYIRPDGSYIWVQMVVARIQINETAQKNWSHVCIAQDINDKKMAEETLHESERSRSVLLSNLMGMAYRCKYDKNWTMTFVSEGCYELTGYKPESLINNCELSFSDIIVPEMREFLWNKWEHLLECRAPFRCEYEIITADGSRKWVLETGQGVFNSDGSVEALEGIIIDITESKQRQIQIQYINDHDPLTNLYNRGYYERAKEQLESEINLPLSIIVVDINGLRLINDAFGHAVGDSLISETAKIIQSCCGENDVLARTGGDEFSIISPNTDCDRANKLLLEIIKACFEYNAALIDKTLEINLSVGLGIRQTNKTSIDDTEKEAEICIDRRKLLDKNSHHNTVLSSIMATMFARSYETEAHALRLGQYAKLIGEKMDLPQSSMDELELFSLLHDIGKIGVDDRILNKPGELTPEEWEIMKRHPEIGFVITMSSPDFASIAECVLSHHERWDGTGYPLGLSGEGIPLLARILAVADAYDAMTSDRVYRKALSPQAAIEEIGKNIGTQFDPKIAKLFIEFVEFQKSKTVCDKNYSMV